MFTGVVTHLGVLSRVESGPGGLCVWVESVLAGCLSRGASVACDGCCLTVTKKDPAQRAFCVHVSQESLSCTTLGSWKAGRRINLERALRLGQPLDGHMLSGHVDARGSVAQVEDLGEMDMRLSIAYPDVLTPLFWRKGSVAINGVSLTINSCANGNLGVNIINHTRRETNLGSLRVGDEVNIEADMLARYVREQLASLKGTLLR